jgi:hypothetical protein
MNAGRTMVYAAALLAVACLSGACGGDVRGGGHPGARDVRAAAATATPPSYRSRAGGYRVLGSPLIFVGEQREGAPPSIDIIVRFNRSIRRDAIDGEGVAADFQVNSSGSLDSAPGALGRPARHCYIGHFGNDSGSLKDPRDGQRAVVTIHVRGVKRNLVMPATIRGPLAVDEQRALTEALCGPV